MVIEQYEIFLIALDPTLGHEIKKTRPGVIISPDEMNEHLETVIIAPMTSQTHPYPSRIPIRFHEKDGWVALDQIRTVDKKRLVKKLGRLDAQTTKNIKAVLKEMFVD